MWFFRLLPVLVALASVLPAWKAAAISCGTDCARECASCTRVLGKTICGVPRASCVKECVREEGLSCALELAHKAGPVHGRYCGLGGRNGRPVDALDAACRAHDRCWARRGQFDCRCDRKLAASAAEIADSGAGSAAMRRKAELIAKLFKKIACLPG